MSAKTNDIETKGNGKQRRGNRMITTVSSHMVNHPHGLQAVRPEQTRKSLLSSCPTGRTRA